MSRTTDEDPLLGCHFLVEIDGFARAGFQNCSEVKVEFDEVIYREGGDQATVRKRPGLAKFGDVTLKRGIIRKSEAGPRDVEAWVQLVFDVARKTGRAGTDIRRAVSIKVHDEEGKLFKTYKLKEVWIKGAELGSALAAESSDNYMETMVLAHEGVEIEYA